MGAKAQEIYGYKLQYSWRIRARNGVDILVDEELVDQVIEVRRKSDHIILIKLVGVEILNVISAYASQIGLTDDIKREFWEELQEVM